MNIPTNQSYKISFCTTCMDRLYHLKETLPANLIDNATYANLEFVILNYNSKDEIDTWIAEEMMAEVRSQRLRYIKTLEPLCFKMSHAKNMVARFASGDIVCNIDADNFTGAGFAEYVNELFNKDKNIFLTGGGGELWDTMGRVCLWKSDFLRLRGYDEKIKDWGYEDTDLYYRVNNQMGRSQIKLADIRYLKTIQHDDFERMKNGIYNSEIEIEFGLVLKTDDFAKAYILKKNNQFEFIIITYNPVYNFADKGLSGEEKIKYGEWSMKEGTIEFKDNESQELMVFPTNDGGETYLAPDGVYQREPKATACFYYSFLKGQLTFYENVTRQPEINIHGFGDGLVFEPFA